ncbi:transmembrane protein 154 isoform X1 [Callorhinchus milii]|uniref:transmembrane protein 154 isoform X1 n=1 Tax=Callorhinchus milii TaxID=7868 RepID=UPI000457611D|nr:transmembrane protein 154 isoform X1 [Callorhinchus milii]|eukprot:gi/632971490/ref/XP_007902197.1/ PREDICTED: transmembrane protein 154 isoform X1 [Callorhinchus milii]
MNQRNSRLFLTLTVALSLSSNTFSSQVNETTTSVNHTEQPKQTDATTTELSPITAEVKYGNHSTISLSLQASKVASSTVSHFRFSSKKQQDVHKTNTSGTVATSIKTTPNKSWQNRSKGYSPSSTTKSGNRKTPNKTFIILVIALPILGLVLLILMVAFVICFTRKKKQILDDEATSENLASPIFEEDIHSVMEVEMDELEKWMGSIKKASQQETLPEEKELNPKSSESES